MDVTPRQRKSVRSYMNMREGRSPTAMTCAVRLVHENPKPACRCTGTLFGADFGCSFGGPPHRVVRT